MAYDTFLSDRISHFFQNENIFFIEKKMFGGLSFMINDKICVGVIKNEVMARIDPGIYEESLTKTGCNTMNFTGRPMKGFVFLSNEAIDLDENLYYWLQLALDYNPKAKSNKKKL
ncbi:TfoX/Sxy family protein [Tenacibaculum halocynthiae]|uniref:TfoX/Sxy family protein n=1 Tax=Tenacibaculum halocynthiae TaxID=1254437 RepID=UPI0038944CDD